MGSSEIARILKVTQDKVCRRLRQLVKYNEVSTIELTKEQAKERFNTNQRTKIYYVEIEVQ